jgi:general stress protein YciG
METATNQHHQQQQPRTKNRGFASMNTDRQREIARKGGRAAHEKGKAHEFTSDEARAAGRKGGEKVSVNRRHMAEIGRRGGRSSAQRRRPSSGGGGGQPGSDAGSGMHRVPEGAGSGAIASEMAGSMGDGEQGENAGR